MAGAGRAVPGSRSGCRCRRTALPEPLLQEVERGGPETSDLVVAVEQPVGDCQDLTPGVPTDCRQQHRCTVADNRRAADERDRRRERDGDEKWESDDLCCRGHPPGRLATILITPSPAPLPGAPHSRDA